MKSLIMTLRNYSTSTSMIKKRFCLAEHHANTCRNLMTSLMRLRTVIDIDQSSNQSVYKATWISLHQAVGPWPKLGEHGGVISWPFLITEEFISLVQSGDWIARIIFLHYSVSMCLWGNRWYVRDWGRRSVLAILDPIDEIPPTWAETISWIKEGVEINN